MKCPRVVNGALKNNVPREAAVMQVEGQFAVVDFLEVNATFSERLENEFLFFSND